MKCNICGADTMSCSDGTYICSKGHINIPTYEPQNCDMPLPQSFGVRYGWICPRCGKVNSPDARSCSCNSTNNTITCNSTESIPTDINIMLSGTTDCQSCFTTVDVKDSNNIAEKYDPTITPRSSK